VDAQPDRGPDPETIVRKVVKRGYDSVTWTFWLTLGMSSVLFGVGLVLLAIAVNRATDESDVSTGTLAIAGLAAVVFLLLFIARPWRDVALTLANAQQVEMISTSYLTGLALVRDGDERTLALLDELTRNCVTLLEAFAEQRGTGSVRTKLAALRRARTPPGVLPPV
jgi:high-affinity nickel permease